MPLFGKPGVEKLVITVEGGSTVPRAAGSTVRGRVTLVIGSQVTYRCLMVELFGAVNVRNDEYVNTYKIVHNYMYLLHAGGETVLERNGGKLTDTLQQGEYTYPFAFTIPKDSLPSLELEYHGCDIKYTLTAILFRDATSLINTVTAQDIQVKSIIPRRQLEYARTPYWMEGVLPLTNNWFSSNGAVEIRVNLDTSMLATGSDSDQKIQVEVNLDNIGAKKPIPANAVDAALEMAFYPPSLALNNPPAGAGGGAKKSAADGGRVSGGVGDKELYDWQMTQVWKSKLLGDPVPVGGSSVFLGCVSLDPQQSQTPSFLTETTKVRWFVTISISVCSKKFRVPVAVVSEVDETNKVHWYTGYEKPVAQLHAAQCYEVPVPPPQPPAWTADPSLQEPPYGQQQQSGFFPPAAPAAGPAAGGVSSSGRYPTMEEDVEPPPPPYPGGPTGLGAGGGGVTAGGSGSGSPTASVEDHAAFFVQ